MNKLLSLCRYSEIKNTKYLNPVNMEMESFRCLNPTLGPKAPLCVFHDPDYYLAYPKKVTQIFQRLLARASTEKKPLICIDYQLPGEIVVRNKKFNSFVILANCSFHSPLILKNVVFNANLELSSSRFSDKVIIENCRLTYSDFSNASFKKGIKMKVVKLNDANFDDVIFADETLFEDISFEGVVYFNHSNFVNKTLFNNFRFRDDALFYRTRFVGNTEFINGSFDRTTRFINTVFLDTGSFANVDFKMPVIFDSRTEETKVKRQADGNESVSNLQSNVYDADFRIEITRKENSLEYNIRLDGFGIGVHHGSFSLDIDPAIQLQKLREIYRAAEDSSRSYDAVAHEIEDAGISLYRKVFKEIFEKLYWKNMYNSKKSVCIMSNDLTFPWEIVRAFDREGDDKHHYISENLCLCHWLPNYIYNFKSDAKSVLIVVPKTTKLKGAKHDKQFISKLAHNHGLRVFYASSLGEFEVALKTGAYDIIHISTHGQTDEIDGSYLELERKVKFKATQITNEKVKIKGTYPLIFMNTCQSATDELTITGLKSWASRFIDVGASSFIGTLWSVGDKMSSLFAQQFYTDIFDGKTLGESFQNARIACKKLSESNNMDVIGDLSYLSYVFFGQPYLRLIPQGGRK